LIQRGLEKPGVSNGGQAVIVVDVDWTRPRAYIHRHKLHPQRVGKQGPNEVMLICEKLMALIDNNNGAQPRQGKASLRACRTLPGTISSLVTKP